MPRACGPTLEQTDAQPSERDRESRHSLGHRRDHPSRHTKRRRSSLATAPQTPLIISIKPRSGGHQQHQLRPARDGGNASATRRARPGVSQPGTARAGPHRRAAGRLAHARTAKRSGQAGGWVMDAPFDVLGWAKGAADADAAACRRGVGRLAQGEGRGEEGAGDARVLTFDGPESGPHLTTKRLLASPRVADPARHRDSAPPGIPENT
jgi:hypothetical protein